MRAIFLGFFIAEAGLQGTMKKKKERNMFKIFHKGARKQEHKKQKKRKKEEGKKQSREKNKEDEEQ